MLSDQEITLTTRVRRLQTGVPGLDELLGGGLLEGRTVLCKGAPGSGKTTLGLQMLVAGAAEYEEPGILLTFEQMPEQLLADAAGFGWDLDGLVRQKRLFINFIRPEDVLEQPGRQENRLLANVADWIDEYGPRRILIDSLSHLRPLLAGEQARPLLLKFLIELKKMGLTPVLTAELSGEDKAGLDGLDAYLADTVLFLDHARGGLGRPDRRALEVVKTRGQRHIGGAHPFEIGPRGLTIYPHAYLGEGSLSPAVIAELPAMDLPVTPDIANAAPAPAVPLPTGVTGLAPLLGGGYTPGSVIMVAGLSGTFKTTMAAHFIGQGREGGNRGLWISFQESDAALATLFKVCGMPAEVNGNGERSERVIGRHYAPGREPIEKILREAEELIDEHGLDRVVIDSLNDLVAGQADDAERQEGVTWFLRRLRALGVTTLCTQRLTRVTGRNPLSEIAWADLADTIVYLGLVEIESRLEKVVSVLKHRGGSAECDLRAIAFASGGSGANGVNAAGLRVSERFVGLSGVLAGTPLGRRKAQIEEIFQPLYFIRDFLGLAQDPGLPDEQRGEILKNLSGETAQLIGLLGRYFDQPAAKDSPPQGGARDKEGRS